MASSAPVRFSDLGYSRDQISALAGQIEGRPQVMIAGRTGKLVLLRSRTRQPSTALKAKRQRREARHQRARKIHA